MANNTHKKLTRRMTQSCIPKKSIFMSGVINSQYRKYLPIISIKYMYVCVCMCIYVCAMCGEAGMWLWRSVWGGSCFNHMKYSIQVILYITKDDQEKTTIHQYGSILVWNNDFSFQPRYCLPRFYHHRKYIVIAC